MEAALYNKVTSTQQDLATGSKVEESNNSKAKQSRRKQEQPITVSARNVCSGTKLSSIKRGVTRNQVSEEILSQHYHREASNNK